MLSKKESFSRAEEVLEVLTIHYGAPKADDVSPHKLAYYIVNNEPERFLVYLSECLNISPLEVVANLEFENVWRNLFE